MPISILARTPALRRQAMVQMRSMHSTAPTRSAHGHYHHLPFAWPGQNKGVFGLKVFLYLASGFSIPIAATVIQLKKAGAA